MYPHGKSQYEPYIVGIDGWKNPQESQIALSSLFQVLVLHSTDRIEMEHVRSPALLRGHSYGRWQWTQLEGSSKYPHTTAYSTQYIKINIYIYNWYTYVYIYIRVCRDKIYRYMIYMKENMYIYIYIHFSVHSTEKAFFLKGCPKDIWIWSLRHTCVDTYHIQTKEKGWLKLQHCMLT